MREPLWKRISRLRGSDGSSSASEGSTTAKARTTPARSGSTAAEREILRRLRDRYAGADVPHGSEVNRTLDADEEVIDLRDRLADMGLDPAKAKAYQEWAERMRRKKEDRKRAQQEESRRAYDPHWDPRHVFEERSSGAHGGGFTRRELLAVLELPPTADDAEVQRQYKKLVKLHHPDRYATAPVEVRLQHEERMRRITAAYRALQTPAFRASPPRT
ncbi:MAG: hypothetical protein KatS3mg008_1379 [Acidimicrobiales bacterium]|nr:MAG: hypothetical protein KatS3mg008_1379 [Acidimicrobiales bacterium]